MPRSPAKPPNRKRQRAERRGRFGETIAAIYLRAKFYRIVGRRLKTPLGEIDLIAQKGDMLVFVEVKLRKNASEEFAAHAAVNSRRIIRAARWYLSAHPVDDAVSQRFDLIFLAPFTWPHHICNAFVES